LLAGASYDGNISASAAETSLSSLEINFAARGTVVATRDNAGLANNLTAVVAARDNAGLTNSLTHSVLRNNARCANSDGTLFFHDTNGTGERNGLFNDAPLHVSYRLLNNLGLAETLRRAHHNLFLSCILMASWDPVLNRAATALESSISLVNRRSAAHFFESLDVNFFQIGHRNVFHVSMVKAALLTPDITFRLLFDLCFFSINSRRSLFWWTRLEDRLRDDSRHYDRSSQHLSLLFATSAADNKA